MRTTVVAFAAFAIAASGVGVAQAAPGDCLILADQPVCEPFDTPDTPPLYSECTDLPPAQGSTLVRRSCQLFRVVDDVAVGDPQTYTYPPENKLPEPTFAPVAERPAYTAPAERPEPVDRPATAAPATPDVPAASAPTQAAPSPATTSTPARIDAAPRPLPAGPPAAPRDTWVDTVDSVVPWAAGVAALVLVFCLVFRPRKA